MGRRDRLRPGPGCSKDHRRAIVAGRPVDPMHCTSRPANRARPTLRVTPVSVRPDERRQSKSVIIVLLTVIAFTVSLLAWAFATPVGSSPDDDFHIANIYCIHDSTTCRSDDWDWPLSIPTWPPNPADRQGPEYAGAYSVYPDLWQYSQPRALPCYVSNGTAWYAPDASIPATCLNAEDPTNNRPGTVDLLGHYPSAYYHFMSVFTGSTIRESVAIWRVINVLIAVAMLSLAILLSGGRYRRPAAVGALVASGPLGFFLVSSINPSAWLIIGTAAFLGPALTQLQEPFVLGWRTGRRLIFLATCLFLMVAGRSEGLLHLVILVSVVLLLGLRVRRRAFAPLIVGALLAVSAVALATPGLMGVGKVRTFTDMAAAGVLGGSIWDSLLAVPSYFVGSNSIMLAWLEVIPPDTAIVGAQAALWGAAILGLAVMYRRKGLALALVLGLLLALPTLLIAGGWQSPPTRYFLPLMYMFAFVVLCPAWTGDLPRWRPAQWWALAAASILANSLSLLYLTVRFVSGIAPGTTSPRALAAAGAPQWWWGAWASPFLNWLLGSIAFALAVAALYWLLAADRPLPLKESDLAGQARTRGHDADQDRDHEGQDEGHAVVEVVEDEVDSQ